MENRKNKRRGATCRLCCGKVHETGEPIDEIKLQMLEILLVKLDTGTSGCVICNVCMSDLEDCFVFKSTFLHTEDFLAPFLENNDCIDLKEVYRMKLADEKTPLGETQVVCRLCMNVTESKEWGKVDNKDEVRLHIMLQKCVPELNLKATGEVSVCNQCDGCLQRYYGFLERCSETEETIASEKINKIEETFVDQSDTNIYKIKPLAKDYEPATSSNVKIEEDEMDFEEGIGIGSIPGSGALGQEDDTLDATYTCTICDFTTKVEALLYDHNYLHNGQDGKFACHECTYETDLVDLLRQHCLTHHEPENQDETKPHHCPECPFKTTTKALLARHAFKHSGDTKLFRCDKCKFKTKYKRSLDAHQAVHEEPKFDCVHCQAKFRTKSVLLKHLQTHKPKAERVFHKCQLCDYKALYRESLKKHMVYHKPSKEIERFPCPHCTFTTIRKDKLKVHMRTHMDKAEVAMHKCPECDYETKWKYNLKHHRLKHKNAFDTTMHKCPTCNYWTKYEGYLKIHIRNHEGTLPVLKCKECEYETTVKGNLKKHVEKRHTNEAKIFSCDKCDFQTHFNGNLKAHKVTHKKFKEAPFRCNDCPFQTKHKASLYTHIAGHRTDKSYTCEFCGVKTKYGSNFRRHLEMCLEGRF